MSEKQMIQCHALSKYYRDGKHGVKVLNNINLTIQPGDRIAIIGASGCGKSTLLHLLTGLDQPTTGKVFWGDVDINQITEYKRCYLRNQRIGFIYQFHHLLREFNVLENVVMPLLIQGVTKDVIINEAKALLKAVGLGDHCYRKVAELSGGERQRVALVRAFVAKPSYVLADEPTGNLDRNTAQEILQLMLKMQEKTNMALVIVTHDIKLVRQLFSIYELSQGQLTQVM